MHLVGEFRERFQNFRMRNESISQQKHLLIHILSCVLKAMINNNLEYTDIEEVRVTCFCSSL